MTERTRRDALEHLQVEVRGLEAELAAEHGPTFVQRRTELTGTLAKERQATADAERELEAARAAEAERQARVTELETRLRTIEQRSLDGLPLLLIGAAVAATLSVRPWTLPLEPFGFGLAALLGLLFGPRVLERLRGGAPKVEARPADGLPYARLLGSMTLLGFALPLTLASASEFLEAMQGHAHVLAAYGLGFGSRALSQVLATLGTLVALRGAGTEARRGTRIAQKVLGGVGLAMFSVLTLRWGIPLLLAGADDRFTDVAILGVGFVPVLPLVLAVRSRWAPLKSNLLRLIASPAISALTIALAFRFRRDLDTPDLVSCVVSVAAQLCATAFALAADLDTTARPATRWGLRLLALFSLGGFFFF